MLHFNYIVMGSGIAGLTFALEAAAHGKVAVLCKADLSETNTSYAQGGIAAVLSQFDSFEEHVQDTLTAGAGLCDEEAVRFMVERAPENIKWLQAQGVQFDSDTDNSIALGLEGGHCQHRIAHVKDHTGLSIQQALSQAARQNPNITVLEHHMGLELITQNINGEKNCCGVQALDLKSGEANAILAKAVVLATGGSGQVFRHTTNPAIATGDGLAMAYRAGAEIGNMEFFQFHPTALYEPGTKDTFLISEALRGAGAELVLPNDEPFMQRYHALGSLAPRDVVARAVYEQMQNLHLPCVYLDARHLSTGLVQQKFPSIYNKCKSIGIDAANDLIPVVPAAHYQCGGVKTGLNGQTSVAGLYAVGEVACTGVHGANRLASNSLLEGVVFAKVAAAHAVRAKSIAQPFPESIADVTGRKDGSVVSDETVARIKDRLRQVLWKHAGIVRTPVGLKKAQAELAVLRLEVETGNFLTHASEVQELQNLLTVAKLILAACLKRNESIGGHFLYNIPAQQHQEYK